MSRCYFVDWLRRGRRLAVKYREHETLQLATPTQYVGNFPEAVALTYEVSPPVRFRLMQVGGPLPYTDEHLAISAVLFGAPDRL